ncbi:hypothetical protein HDU98_006396 [Podochytrium sp. JEL0797]|nr:hypothetical protein HDU98_006396 [Podochytrium sp. JEL0797]
MNASTVADLHRLLVNEIVDMRAEMLSKTEYLLTLLDSFAAPTRNPTKQSISPARRAFAQDMQRSSKAVSYQFLSHESHASMLSLGIRLTGEDYSADIEANKSLPPKYDKMKAENNEYDAKEINFGK